MHSHGQSTGPVEVEVGVGAIAADCTSRVVSGFVRDGDLGQTYVVVRRLDDEQIVRRWVAPEDPLVFAIPWATVNSQYTFPVGVVAAIPLDDRCPPANMLVRRFSFDGTDDRIFTYDAGRGRWRHVPDEATFQALGVYRCDVTVADIGGVAGDPRYPPLAGFLERITTGEPYPASTVPARADYPNCGV